MNPLTNVRNIKRLGEIELQRLDKKGSWHDDYKGSAYIFIGGLSYEMSEGDILAVFSQYGEVTSINLPKEKDSGKPRGFCFLCYEDQRSTVLAVENFNGIKLCGRVVRVDHVKDYKQSQAKEGAELGEIDCAPKTPPPELSSASSYDSDEWIAAPRKKAKREKKKKKKRKHDKKEVPHKSEGTEECPVCILPLKYPVRLSPCGHVFCFLCIKGVCLRSGSCPLCRAAISKDIAYRGVTEKELLTSEGVDQLCSKPNIPEGSRVHWCYEGYRGWWEYDGVTGGLIEEAHKSRREELSVFLFGNEYKIDLKKMQQQREGDSYRVRRIRRSEGDLSPSDRKGVAGIFTSSSKHSSKD